MKFSTALATLCLLGNVSANDAASEIKKYRCDDELTSHINVQSPILKEKMDKALEYLNLMKEMREQFDTQFEAEYTSLKNAEANEIQAREQFNLTDANKGTFHDEYEAASIAFKACNPDDPATGCTLTQQSLLAFQMEESSRRMIENDNTHQKNVNILDQMTLELNVAQADLDFAQAGATTKRARIDLDLSTAADAYQFAKDKWERYEVSDTDNQKNCMLNQYSNDMAWIDILDEFLTKCQTSGCKQGDADILMKQAKEAEAKMAEIKKRNDAEYPYKISDTYVGWADPDRLKYLKGAIKFPDCGPVISEECFWKHHEKSGVLDFLSFFGAIPALVGCNSFKEYDTALCQENFAYVLVEGFSRQIAPPEESWL